MKKTLITLALASMATTATAANVYSQNGSELNIGGRAEFRGDFNGKENGDKVDGTMQNKSRFRLNVGGSTEINDNLTGYGFYEAEQTVNSSDDNSQETNFKQRYMYAGLKGNWGALSFGRQNTAGVQISDMSDIATFTGAQKSFIASGDEQVNNTIAYGVQVGGANVQASYILGEEDNSDGYGVSVLYSFPVGVGIALGYSANDSYVENDVRIDQQQNQVIAGVNYSHGGLYTALTYTNGDYNDTEDFNGTEFAIQYKFHNDFKLIGAYQNQEIDGDKTSDFIEVTAGYDFADNIYGYLSYMNNRLDAGDGYGDIRTVDAEDTVRLGLRYTF
ncbi:porin [Photobacterium rosenbergii]|uniref:Porin n=1 Tax=Photobacterium rosenbergii TaxID=294936 RepID=A0A2T3NI09_9GAMM|nr:porin [Photobacterium rosenbergii]PSW14593.1 porin [Photobacterium rosenbergii]